MKKYTEPVINITSHRQKMSAGVTKSRSRLEISSGTHLMTSRSSINAAEPTRETL